MTVSAQPGIAECRPCEFSDPVGQTVLNSLSAHIAILDDAGVILQTNRAWLNYARANGMTDRPDSIGANYLATCDAATGDEAADAHKVADGIRAVIAGKVTEFLHDYPCHGPDGRHWYYMRAIRLEATDPIQVVVSHEDITALKHAEAALQQRSEELKEQTQSLEEANIALKVLLRQREQDKQDLEQKMLSNIKDLVLPYVEKLKRAPLKPKDKTLVQIIDTHLADVISPLLQRLTNANIILTPQEMQVATLVKDGKSSKEIAAILNIAETTVHFHRKNLREKFGLKNRQTNLRSYLMSMS